MCAHDTYMIFSESACCCTGTVRWRRTEAVCRPASAVVWTKRIRTAVGPDIRACCPVPVTAAGCCRTFPGFAAVGWPGLRKENTRRFTFWTVHDVYNVTCGRGTPGHAGRLPRARYAGVGKCPPRSPSPCLCKPTKPIDFLAIAARSPLDTESITT